MRFEEVEVLHRHALDGCPILGEIRDTSYLMINAEFDIFAPLFLFLDESRRQTSASCVDHRTTFFSLDGRVKAQVLSTGESQGPEVFRVS